LLTELNKIRIQEKRKNEKEVLREQEEVTPSVDATAEGASSKIDVQSMVYYQERETIRLLLNYADNKLEDQSLSDFLVHELEDVEFVNPVFNEIYATFKNGLASGEVLDNNYFVRKGSEVVKRTVTDLVTPRYETSQHWGEKFHIYFSKEEDVLNEMALTNVLRLKFRVVQKMMEDNLQLVKQAEAKGDWEELDKTLETQTGLKKAETELAGLLGIVVAK
jgi:DNA primase